MTQPRKNILLISFDDAIAFWRYKNVFNAPLQTPNFDRICAESTAFHAAMCQSPICGPSRASFMSGKAPHQSGVLNNRTRVFSKIRPQDMWPHRLKQAGYFCSSGGKMHHGFLPLAPEMHDVLYSDERKRFRIDIRTPANMPYKVFGGHKEGRGTTRPEDDTRYHDANSAASFQHFLDTYDGDAPFYREVGFFGPHGPFMTPERFKTMYDHRRFKQPLEWRTPFPQNKYATGYTSRNMDLSLWRYWKRSVRNYFSAVTHVDHHLGAVWDALRASRHYENTIVIILSDHGFHLGERNLFRKGTLWEQVANVPFVVHDPSRPAQQTIGDPSALLDLGPTVLDYAGLPPMETCAGRSLRPVVEGGRITGRAIPTFMGRSVAIRKGDYRLIRYVDGSTELYDVVRDFWQINELGRDHPVFDEMYASLMDASGAYGLPLASAA
ncbi:MAG: sulfatase-like hydrolase/transferase [Pseudomonadota bacterium]